MPYFKDEERCFQSEVFEDSGLHGCDAVLFGE